MTAPRVVLDTNCLLSALVFTHGRSAWLRTAWQSGRIRVLMCRDTMHELLRVVHYPKFKLSSEEAQALLSELLPFVESIQLHAQQAPLPEVRDPHDTVFLALAAQADANALVTGDLDLLAVKAQFRIPIITPAEFYSQLHTTPSPPL